MPLTSLTAGVESRKGTVETVLDYYKPSLGAQLMAAFRRMCGQGDPYFLSRHQVASSVRLQMLLYFNLYLAGAYAILHPMIFQWKAVTWPPKIIVAVHGPGHPSPLHICVCIQRAFCAPEQVCNPMFFYVWLVMEPIRLVVGYVGNLGERVAWLAPFWILTLFPQLLTQAYFIVSYYITGWVTLPIEYVMHVLLLLLCARGGVPNLRESVWADHRPQIGLTLRRLRRAARGVHHGQAPGRQGRRRLPPAARGTQRHGGSLDVLLRIRDVSEARDICTALKIIPALFQF